MLGESTNLIRGCQALVHRPLRDLQHRLARQRLIERLINSKSDIEFRGPLILQLRLRIRLRAAHQVMRAPEIGDQLGHRQAARSAIVDRWIVEKASGDAAVFVRAYCGQATRRRRQLAAPHFAGYLRLR